jgi:hypothetical protein
MVSCQLDVPKSGEFNGSAKVHGGQTVFQHHCQLNDGGCLRV